MTAGNRNVSANSTIASLPKRRPRYHGALHVSFTLLATGASMWFCWNRIHNAGYGNSNKYIRRDLLPTDPGIAVPPIGGRAGEPVKTV